MSQAIRRAAVIGSGTMGAQIAAHLTNAGIPTLILDIPATEGKDKNAIVKAGVERARKAKPAAFMAADRAHLLTLGNTEDDFAKLGEVDWIIEAVFEKLDVKHELWERVEKVAAPHAIISSNSSGIPMAMQIEGRSDSFKARFVGAHFFVPPRYLYLLELIPTPHTTSQTLATLREFGDKVLGKGIVIANDVPGFVANRIGVYSLMQCMKAMNQYGLTPNEVDVLTGTLIGRPKSATFRTADLSGIDVLANVANGLAATTGEDFALPPIISAMLEKKLLGEKTKAGFYKADKSSGKRTILTLNFDTLEYEDRGKVTIKATEEIKKLDSASARHKALMSLEGKYGDFMRVTTYDMLHYACEKVGVVASDYREIDNGLKWGFAWELGPFEIIDILGHQAVADAFVGMGKTIPAILSERIASGEKFYPETQPSTTMHGAIVLKDLKRDATKIIKKNSGASLVDLGDGIALLEFHSKMNALGDEAVNMGIWAQKNLGQNFEGLVVGNNGENFSAGANLAAILGGAQAGEFDEINIAIKRFQKFTVGMRYAPFPVVVAPFNLALGGGCEIQLWSDAVQASAELYTGLVEMGVGLIPAGGGTTEMLIRFAQQLHPEANPFEAPKRAFMMIAMAKVSTSALEAREMGILRANDGITMNRARVIQAAKERALTLAKDYVIPTPRTVTVLGESAYANLVQAAWSMREANQITDYDLHLAKSLARILSGGLLNRKETVSEDYLLDLEREVFLSLCGQRKTQERIASILTKGKPLRN